MTFRSIKARILCFHIVTIFIANIILVSISYQFMVNRLIYAEKDTMHFVADHAVNMLRSNVLRKKDALRKIANRREVVDYFDTYRDLALAEYLAGFNKEFSQISFLNSDAYEEVKVDNGVMVNVFDAPCGSAVQECIQSGANEVKIIFPRLENITDPSSLHMIFNKYAYFENKYLGTLLASVSYSDLLLEVSSTNVHSKGLMALWGDGQDDILIQKFNEEHIQHDSPNLIHIPSAQRDGQKLMEITAGSEDFVTTNILGIKSLVAYVPIPELQMHLVATLPYKIITDQLSILRNRIAIVFVVICLLAVILTILLARTISRPICQLTEVVRKVAAGSDNTQGLAAIENQADEVGILASSFRTMLENLWHTTVSRDYVDSIFAAMAECVVVITETGRIRRVNTAAYRLLGYNDEEFLNLSIYDLLIDEITIPDFIGQFMDKEEWQETSYLHKDGRVIPVLFSCSSLTTRSGDTETVCVASDISSLQKARKNLEENEAYLKALMDSLPSGLLVIDVEKQVVIDTNPAACSLYQCQKEDLVGQVCSKLMEPIQKVDAWPPVVTEENPLIRMECELVSPYSSGRVPIIMSVQAITLRGILIYINSFVDITENKRALNALKESEEKLRSQAITDELTGLFNRRGFLALVEKQLLIASRNNKTVYLLYADVDNLKQVNDGQGHAAGDDLICRAAEVLKSVCRKSDIVGRLGGDEFAVLLTDAKKGDAVIQRLDAGIAENNSVRSNRDAPILAISMGIVSCCELDQGAPCLVDDLLLIADSKMYDIKQKRKKQTLSDITT